MSEAATAAAPAAALAARLVAAGAIGTHAAELSLRQVAVLDHAVNSEDRTVKGIAAALELTKPPITRAADRLQSLGFIKRRPHEEDRRLVSIEATPAGVRELQSLARALGGAS